MSMMELNKETIGDEIAKTEVAIIEFYSNTCSVCKMLTPVLEELSQKQKKAKFFKINTEQNMQACMTYRVLSLPTTLVFKKGELLDKLSGFKTIEEVEEILNKVV